jgi:diguanylate cyclase (GGDEF)-like protein
MDFDANSFAADLDAIVGGDGDKKPKRKRVSTPAAPSISTPQIDPIKVRSILDRMRGGTSGQESSGDPSIVNPDSGATGEFQVMPYNIPNWTRKHYGRELSQEEFRNNPQAQKSVFDGEMGKYVKKALIRTKGDEDLATRMAAAAWYGGPGAMNRYDDPTPQYTKGKPYPSFRDYTTSVLKRSKGDNPKRDGFADFLKGLDGIVPAQTDVDKFKTGMDGLDAQPQNDLQSFSQGLDAIVPGDNKGGQPVTPTVATPQTLQTPAIPTPVPETPQTLEAQVTSAMDANSPRSAVLLTDPAQEKLLPSNGLKRIQTPNGILLVNDKKVPNPEEYVKQNGFASLIGKVEDVGNNTDKGTAVRTEDANGNELSTSIVSPANAQKQAEVDKRSFPHAAKQELMSAPEAVQKRKEDLQKAAVPYSHADFKAWADFNKVPMTPETRKSFEAELKTAGPGSVSAVESDLAPVDASNFTPDKFEARKIEGQFVAPNKALPDEYTTSKRDMTDGELLKSELTVPVEVPKGTQNVKEFVTRKGLEGAGYDLTPEQIDNYIKTVGVGHIVSGNVTDGSQVNVTVPRSEIAAIIGKDKVREKFQVARNQLTNSGVPDTRIGDDPRTVMQRIRGISPEQTLKENRESDPLYKQAEQNIAEEGGDQKTIDLEYQRLQLEELGKIEEAKRAHAETGQLKSNVIAAGGEAYLLGAGILHLLNQIPNSSIIGDPKSPHFTEWLEQRMRSQGHVMTGVSAATDDRNKESGFLNGLLNASEKTVLALPRIALLPGGIVASLGADTFLKDVGSKGHIDEGTLKSTASAIASGLILRGAEPIGKVYGNLARSAAVTGGTFAQGVLTGEDPEKAFEQAVQFGIIDLGFNLKHKFESLVGKPIEATDGTTSKVLTVLANGDVAEAKDQSVKPEAVLDLSELKNSPKTVTKSGGKTAPEIIPAEGVTKPAINVSETKEGKIEPGTFEEVSRTTQRRDTAERAANTDPLTGLANKRALDKALPTAEKDENTSVVVFDANNFGKVNKNIGQEKGDDVLRELGDSIRLAAEESGVQNRVFRRGGDEFVVLAPKETAEKVRARAEELFGERTYGEDRVSLTGTVAGTFKDADSTLQAAKAERKKQNAQPAQNETTISPQPAPLAEKPLVQDQPVQSETKTVVHPSENINGKPIIAETQDGKVVVPNPENKSGVSVVTNHDEAKQLSNKEVEATQQVTSAARPESDLVSNKKVAKIISEPGTGQTQTIKTERGTSAQIHPKIVDSADILTSLDEGYPAEFQPRQRERAASKAQIANIANNLDPEFLGDSVKASDGRPLVVPVELDGKTKYAVISGNGRSEAIRQAYRTGKAEAYRSFADAKGQHSAKEPVYVGVLDPKAVDLKTFAREANESGTAKMSATEQAKVDSENITSDLMGKFVASDDGSIHGAANRDFIRGFMESVPESERGSLVTADGSLSQEGVTRVRNAIFAKAYGATDSGMAAIQRLAESTDNNVKRISNSLLQNAGAFADLKQNVENGTRFEGLDITDSLVRAMEKFSFLRDEGMKVEEYVNQQGLFGEDLTPFQKRLLVVFDTHKNSGKAITSILNNYIRLADALGDPNQTHLFGEPTEYNAPTVFREAVLEYENSNARPAANQTGLFTPDQGREVQSETVQAIEATDQTGSLRKRDHLALKP